MSLRIAIDGYRLVGPPTSVGTYTEELFDALHAEDCEIVLLAPHAESGSFLERILLRQPSIKVLYPETRETPYSGWGKLARWNQWIIPGLLQGQDIDALISTYHQVPVRAPAQVARIAIIHDCCGLRVDCGYRQFGRAWWKHWSNLKSSAVFADVIVPISRATHDDFLRRHPGSASRLANPIYNQVSRPVLAEKETLGMLGEFEVVPQSYVLGFALAGKRKGTDVALRAYSEYRQHGGNLALVLMGGDKLDLEEWGLPPEFHSDVIRVGRVSNEARDALYAHAACLLFFSRCEGFGYPIIEAARQGCPVVAWRTGTAPELLGPVLPLMENLTSSDGAQLIQRFSGLAQPERQALREQLIAQSLRFASGNTGSQFLAAVERAVDHRRNTLSA